MHRFADEPMTQLLLIRHATNDWVGKRLAGWTPGVHLNAHGRAEAATLTARLRDHPIDAIHASPLERTLETAAFLALPRGLTVLPLPDVGEVRFGAWTGQAIEDLRKDPLWAGVQHYPSVTRFPDGETLGEVQARAVAALGAVVDAAGEAVGDREAVVAVVSHADVIKVVLAHYAGVHLDLFQRLDVAPASVSVVHLTVDGPRIAGINLGGPVPPPSRAPTTAAAGAGTPAGPAGPGGSR